MRGLCFDDGGSARGESEAGPDFRYFEAAALPPA